MVLVNCATPRVFITAKRKIERKQNIAIIFTFLYALTTMFTRTRFLYEYENINATLGWSSWIV